MTEITKTEPKLRKPGRLAKKNMLLKELRRKNFEKVRKAGWDQRKHRPLTLKQKRFIVEYIKTGNGSAAARAAYNTTKKGAGHLSHVMLRQPKIKNEIDKAMAALNLDEDFAVKALKDVMMAGANNLDQTKPQDVLRGLEMFFKLKGYLGVNKSISLKADLTEKAKGMSVTQIEQELNKLDERQKKLAEFIQKEKIIEGEIINDPESVNNEVQ